jgi:hypothetical protein
MDLRIGGASCAAHAGLFMQRTGTIAENNGEMPPGQNTRIAFLP